PRGRAWHGALHQLLDDPARATPRAFTALRRLADFVCGGSSVSAEDLAQSVLLRILEQPPGKRPLAVGDGEAYVRRVLRNAWVDELRRSARAADYRHAIDVFAPSPLNLPASR